MRRYVVDRHPLVRRDLFDIARLIGDYAGYRLADKKIDDIERSIASLEDFPKIGTVRNEIVPGLRALPAAEKATICFTVDDETRIVKVVCVAYAGQDWQKIAAEREGQTLSRDI